MRSTRKEEMILRNEGGNDELYALGETTNEEEVVKIGGDIFDLFPIYFPSTNSSNIRDILWRAKFSSKKGVV